MSNQAVLLCAAQRSLYRFTAFAQTVIKPDTVFETSWVNRAVHYQLKQMEEGEHTRLLLNIPNGYHNRIMVSTARVAWKLGQDPNQRFLVILPRVENAYLDVESMMAEFAKLFNADFYSAIFPYVEPSQISRREFQTGDSGRIYVTRACEQLPPYAVDHIISLDAEYEYQLLDQPETSREADWLLNTAFKTLNSAHQSTITILNKRTSWIDISTLIKSGDFGHWEHLDIQHHSNGENAYQIRRNGDERMYTTLDGEKLPKDPEDFNPEYENNIQNMALHGLLFAINDEMPGMWALFQTNRD